MQKINFANRANAQYIDDLYQQYQRDAASVPEEWQAFFAGFELAGGARAAFAAGKGREGSVSTFTLGVQALVHAYRELGHFVANLDPLGHNRPSLPLLDLSEFNISPADLDRRVGTSDFLGKTDGTLRDLIDKLRATYCRTMGVEYLAISDKNQRAWLEQRMEPVCNQPPVSADDAKVILQQLVHAQGFEEYIHTKYIGAKRFSLEGAESFIPMLNALIEDGSSLGIEQFVFGMAHRGRLNTLAHVLHKPYEIILGEFEGHLPQPDEGDGDVKYHLGYSSDRKSRSGRGVHLSLSFNPSHLELVNPVVEGMVRAKQTRLGDLQRGRVIPVLIHGDASFTGQGVVLETLALSEMPYWRTGGTIHIIINNQIGFTTMPKQGRFTPYPTDVAKTIQAPIFHVNGDDPDACVWAAKLAVAFRQQFHCDVMIDLFCYRRHGHNEGDEPSFTQPLMYKEITQHPPVRDIYLKQLEQQSKVTASDLRAMQAELRQRLDAALAIAREHKPRQAMQTLGGLWTGMKRGGESRRTRPSAPRSSSASPTDSLDCRRASHYIPNCESSCRTGWKWARGRCRWTGARPRRWPSAACYSKARRSGSLARTRSAAPSAIATRACTITRPAPSITRWPISIRGRRRSSSSTRCSRSWPCWALNTASARPIRRTWSCGRRSSATSSTAPSR